MSEFVVAPGPWPSKDEAAREYLLDMLRQLARLARGAGEAQIAILLEAVLAADAAAPTADGRRDRLSPPRPSSGIRR